MGIVAGLSNLAGVGNVSTPGVRPTTRDFLGLLDAYQQGAQKLTDWRRELQPQYSDIIASEASRLAPGAMDLIRGSSPDRTALIAKMLAAGNEGDLNYGTGLPKALLRLTNQYSRTGQAARGLGFGPSDVYGETGDAARMGMDLTDRNRAFAAQAAGASYQYETDPFLRLLGGQLNAANNQLLSPAQSLDLIKLPYQGRLAARTASSNNSTQLMTEASRGFDSSLSMAGGG